MKRWVHALKASDLSGRTKGVARWFADYADYNSGKGVWLSLATLAADSGFSESSCKRALKDLQEAGFINLVKAGKDLGKTNLWDCTLPVGHSDLEVGHIDLGVVQSDLGVGHGDLQTLNNTHSKTHENTYEDAVPASDEGKESPRSKDEEEVAASPLSSLKEDAAGTAAGFDDDEFESFGWDGQPLKEETANAGVGQSELPTEVEEILSESQYPAEARALFLDPQYRPNDDQDVRARWAAFTATPVTVTA
ncbi:helix-turn-helix domain-containing protein [Streptomyces sp. NPDC085900]|uniref:helix-turn-helix domain-containing protein n=1 Tax=Streptomyces sp. NPDC085900 TaxID=3365737 RepID=UPI0037CDF32C